MNGLTLNEICCLFCCPPFPSQIVAKLAFLPPNPTYKLVITGDQTVYPNNEQTALNSNTNNTSNTSASEQTGLFKALRNSGRRLCSTIVCSHVQNNQHQQAHTNAKIVMLEKAEWQYGPFELEKLDVFLTRTEQGHQIACLYVKCTPKPKFTILLVMETQLTWAK